MPGGGGHFAGFGDQIPAGVVFGARELEGFFDEDEGFIDVTAASHIQRAEESGGRVVGLHVCPFGHESGAGGARAVQGEKAVVGGCFRILTAQ